MDEKAIECLVGRAPHAVDALHHYSFFDRYFLPGTKSLYPVPPGPEFVSFAEAFLERMKREHEQREQQGELQQGELKEGLLQTETLIRRLRGEALSADQQEIDIFFPYWKLIHSFAANPEQENKERSGEEAIIRTIKDPVELQYLDIGTALERILDDDDDDISGRLPA